MRRVVFGQTKGSSPAAKDTATLRIGGDATTYPSSMIAGAELATADPGDFAPFEPQGLKLFSAEAASPLTARPAQTPKN